MRLETEAPPEDQDLDDDIELVSKTQLKRDAKALQALGKQICAYNDEQLDRIPLDDSLRDAVFLARKLVHKRGALKRHYQFIGKLLRNSDVEPIIAAVDAIEDSENQGKRLFKLVETWRDRILKEGNSAINEYCDAHPQCDRQQLRQLWRNYHHANHDKRHAIVRHLFRELKANIGEK
jgi:ribosome-associated protein